MAPAAPADMPSSAGAEAAYRSRSSKTSACHTANAIATTGRWSEALEALPDGGVSLSPDGSTVAIRLGHGTYHPVKSWGELAGDVLLLYTLAPHHRQQQQEQEQQQQVSQQVRAAVEAAIAAAVLIPSGKRLVPHHQRSSLRSSSNKTSVIGGSGGGAALQQQCSFAYDKVLDCSGGGGGDGGGMLAPMSKGEARALLAQLANAALQVIANADVIAALDFYDVAARQSTHLRTVTQ
jgi:hypothetical protein